MKVFYHGDMDGIASAHILCSDIIAQSTKYSLKKKENNIIEFDYNTQQQLMDLDYVSNEVVYFVDCSPNEELLNFILNRVGQENHVFIIDHHISRKEMLEDYYSRGNIDGMFYNGASATLITYCWKKMIVEEGKSIDDVKEFLDWFGMSKEHQEDSNIPLSIRLINSWDIWNNLYIDAEPYKIVFESKHLVPMNKDIDDFLYNPTFIKETIRKGYIMKEQMDTWAETFMKRFGYEVEYDGYKFFVANLGNGNSKYFGKKIKEYDAVIPYCFNGKYWTCSIYSDSSKDFDCSEFATKFGGGGHKKAAGFKLETLPEWLLNPKK